jgi:hypothetical protein
MVIIVAGTGVITADHTGHTPDPTVNYVFVQGTVRSSEETAQEVINSLVAKADHHVSLVSGNINVITPVGEVLYGHPDYLLGPFQGIVFVELNMHRSGDFGLG